MPLQKISCVIPVFNRSHCVKWAIDSALRQGDAVGEILVIDDGSTDNLDKIINSYGDKVQLVRHAENQGAAAARNTGIAHARCTYIAFLDSDDRWNEGKLDQQLRFMQSADLDICCTNFSMAFNADAPATPAYRPYAASLRTQDFLWGCYVAPGSTLMAKTAVLEVAGGYDTSFRRYEDWDLLLRLSFNQNIRLGFLDRPLAEIHVSGAPPSAQSRQGLKRLEMKHLKAVKSLGITHWSRFRAGLSFNRASLEEHDGNYGATISSLVTSILLWPIGNHGFKFILIPRLLKGMRGRSAPSRRL